MKLGIFAGSFCRLWDILTDLGLQTYLGFKLTVIDETGDQLRFFDALILEKYTHTHTQKYTHTHTHTLLSISSVTSKTFIASKVFIFKNPVGFV